MKKPSHFAFFVLNVIFAQELHAADTSFLDKIGDNYLGCDQVYSLSPGENGQTLIFHDVEIHRNSDKTFECVTYSYTGPYGQGRSIRQKKSCSVDSVSNTFTFSSSDGEYLTFTPDETTSPPIFPAKGQFRFDGVGETSLLNSSDFACVLNEEPKAPVVPIVSETTLTVKGHFDQVSDRQFTNVNLYGTGDTTIEHQQRAYRLNVSAANGDQYQVVIAFLYSDDIGEISVYLAVNSLSMSQENDLTKWMAVRELVGGANTSGEDEANDIIQKVNAGQTLDVSFTKKGIVDYHFSP